MFEDIIERFELLKIKISFVFFSRMTFQTKLAHQRENLPLEI